MRDPECLAKHKFVIALWCDLSLTTGYSINERESTVALLDQFPERIRVVCPRPAFPSIFFDPRIEYVHNHHRHHPLHYLRFLIAFWRKLRRIMREEDDCVLVFRLGPLPLVPAWAVRTGKPVILKKLGTHSPFAATRRHRIRRLTEAVGRRLYTYIVKGCIGADVESRVYGEWLKTAWPIDSKRMVFIPNGANVEVFSPKNYPESRTDHRWARFERTVGYVGAIDSLRGADLALDAVRRLHEVPGLVFVLIGEGPLADPIREQAKRERLEERIVLPGFVPYAELPTVIAGWDLAIDLTRVPFQIGEAVVHGSYSQKIAQYLACGVPVLAWDTEDTRFLRDRGVGLTVPVCDAEGLAQEIKHFFEERNDHSSMRDRARVFACQKLASDVLAKRRVKAWDVMVGRSVGNPGT